MQGNPWLGEGTARVIVNEVNASDPSRLRGYVEVAGDRAQVVIANPTGIACDGCGFINANRAILTTGTPQFENGRLESYRVRGGTVSIDGAGLDASQTDYTDVIARSVEVNAGVWANELKVTAGANQVSADHRRSQPIAGTGEAPAVAIDVAQLGGMYAGKITLVGGEAGVGVRNAGQIGASVGEVVITADGRLENAGRISSAATTRIDATAGIANSGSVYAQQSLRLDTRGDIDNGGFVAAEGDVTLRAAGERSKIRSDGETVIAAGLSGDGELTERGSLTIAATQSVEVHGQTLAAGDLTVRGNAIDLADSQTSARNLDLRADTADIDLSRASVEAAQTLSAEAARTLRSDTATLSAERLTLNAHELSNIGGVIVQTGRDDFALNLPGKLDNSAGRIAVNSEDLTLTAPSVDNRRGRIEHAGTGDFHITTSTLAGEYGEIISNGAVRLKANRATLDDASTQAAHIRIEAESLSNRGGRIVQTGDEATAIEVATRFDHSAGTLTSNAGIHLTTGEFTNRSGTVEAGGDLTLTASADVDNADGALSAAGDTQLEAAALDNVDGQITAGQTLQVTSTRLDNERGLMAADGAVTISATEVDNDAGTIGSVHDGVPVTANSGDVSNETGRIEAAQSLAINSRGIDNADGVISGEGVVLDSRGGAFDNQQGLVVARDTLTIHSGALTNDTGLFQAGGALVIDTNGQRLSNSETASRGGIVGQNTLTIRAGALNNAEGFVGAKERIHITALEVDNSAGGRIAGEQTIDLSATGLDNRGGQLQALSDIMIDAGAGVIDNRASLIRSGGAVELHAQALENASTSGSNQGLEGRAIAIDANRIGNEAGAVRADETITVIGRGSVDNDRGLISAGKMLRVADRNPTNKTQRVSNAGGTLIAGDSLVLDSARYSGDGEALSLGDLTVTLSDDFSQTGVFRANDTLALTTAGEQLTNRGELLAGDAARVSAATIDNRASGEIGAAEVTLTATGGLTNRGLIDGQHTRIQAGRVDNRGSGRVYGDRLAIETNTLVNDIDNGQAGVIAARERLDIGTRDLVNREHALIFSAGDLAIGGSLDGNWQAKGQAQSVHNASATIEALSSLELAAEVIRNTNEHFSTHVVEVSREDVQEYQLSGSPNRYSSDQISVYYSGEVDKLVTPEGEKDKWNRYDVTRVIHETRVLTSDPGEILAGGAMRLDAEALLNDNSRFIAGGSLTADVGTLTNTEVADERRIDDSGTSTHYYRIQEKGRDRQGTSTSAYNPPETIQEITLTPAVMAQNTAVAGSGATVDGRHTTPIDATVATTNVADATIGAARVVNPITEVRALTSHNDAGAAEVIRRTAVNTQIPTNSLFRPNPVAASGYLIETDPRFTDYRTWLSSDYMLERLAHDPARTQQRLGDGFYEQKLIREQVVQLTGRRFLDGYANDEAQYRALIDNAVTVAEQWDLLPGVALTPAQMAQLTSDIVWLVEQEVALPDGTTTRALVPQVYARVREGDLDGSGALLAGDSLELNARGAVVNSGRLAARQVTAITAETIDNLGGRIEGRDVALHARGDLTNLGGRIAAADSLSVSAGRDLNVVSTTRDSVSAQGRRTSLARVAGLYVTDPGGTLTASAGRDVNLQAADVVNRGEAGQTLIAAGRDLSLTTVTESSEHSVTWNRDNWRKDSSRSDVGTTIHTTGDVHLAAGDDLNARAARVTSVAGAVVATAGDAIRLTAGERTRSLEEAHKVRGSNSLFSSKTTTTYDAIRETTAQGTTFSGETAVLQAGGDIELTGSHTVSTAGTSLAAGGDIQLEAATHSVTETHDKRVKKSGLFSDGGLSITAGTQRQSVADDATRRSAAASTVGATDGDVTITAGGRYRQVGSDVVAPKGDITIAAEQVDIVAARETSVETHETHFKQSGLTASVTNPIVSALETAGQMQRAAEQVGDGRLQTLALATTGLGISNAADAVAADPSTAGGINLAVTVGSAKSESQRTRTSERAAASTVAAGGDVVIDARGADEASDLTVRGSRLSAGGDLTLQAEGDIALLAAANTTEQTSTHSGSSSSVGVGISYTSNGAAAGVTASASASRGEADGEDVTWRHTEIEAGDTLTLASGADTTLRGAVARGERVIAEVGGDLTLESVQDTHVYDSEERSYGGSVTAGYGFAASASAGQQAIDADYASVTDQTGIQAGDGGFDVSVAGHTDLVGAVIASTEQAVTESNNRLTTGTLTQSDIRNEAQASAKSIGVTLTDDMATQGKYGAGKAAIGTAVNNGKDAGSSAGSTRSVVSAATVTIVDGDKQLELTEQTAQEVVASLNRDTADAHTAARRLDVDDMADTAAAQQAIKQQTYRQAARLTDESYRRLFLDHATMYELVKDDNGDVVLDENGRPQRRELSETEKRNLKAGVDGKVHVANNGIFNDADAAAKYANQHSTAGGPQYLIHFPQADNAISELLVAGYQKFLENDFWGLSNATEETVLAMDQYGQDGLHVDSHSRGAMTTGNAIESLALRPDAIGSLAGTTAKFFGPAENAAKADAQRFPVNGNAGGVATRYGMRFCKARAPLPRSMWWWLRAVF